VQHDIVHQAEGLKSNTFYQQTSFRADQTVELIKLSQIYIINYIFIFIIIKYSVYKMLVFFYMTIFKKFKKKIGYK